MLVYQFAGKERITQINYTKGQLFLAIQPVATVTDSYLDINSETFTAIGY